ncbi:uncharacterized protein LOC113305324 [Papaver somniferum]|uniref:uncharacterized protein LOC113305324 n=1 Tax=Papaver somniferum TaxID=3469 RepID=UPI000E704BE2|nr:uncharacterized protein LOC113305324 [Papaver somniferum]
MGEDATEPTIVEKLIEVKIGEKHKTTFVWADLPAQERDGLITLLRENADVFAWSFADMPRIDPNVAFHGLNIDDKFHPVHHKIRNMAQIKKDGVTAEVRKLLEAGFIRLVQYPRWLSNVVPVPKKNGYNQIPLFEEDQDHTAFVTDRGVYCYTVMPFGLKNAGATYQHLVDHIFKDLIGKSMEVYIDDMVVKSEQKESHLLDLHKTFDILRQYCMKLNPAKCSFGLSSGKFLGYLMTHKGIEANLEQIRAIREMSSPRTKKEVQKLAGRLVALNRFISSSSNRFKPFFHVLKKAVNFCWTDECEKAFNEIKQYLSTPPPPVLVSPKTGQPIGVYLAATENTISALLFVMDPHEKPVYFVKKGHALDALLADFPVDDIKTVVGEEEELFKPIESATDQTGGESSMEVDTPEPLWTVFTDGLSNVGGAGVGCVILTPEGSRIEKATRLGFQASNNEAEYEAAIIGLKAVKQLDATNVNLVTDSMLVVNQFLGTY